MTCWNNKLGKNSHNYFMSISIYLWDLFCLAICSLWGHLKQLAELKNQQNAPWKWNLKRTFMQKHDQIHRKPEQSKGQKEETKTENVFLPLKHFHYFKKHFTFKTCIKPFFTFKTFCLFLNVSVGCDNKVPDPVIWLYWRCEQERDGQSADKRNE